MNKWKYIVWVNDVDDYYTIYKRAKEHYDEWIEKDYDQVSLVRIKDNKVLYTSNSKRFYTERKAK